MTLENLLIFFKGNVTFCSYLYATPSTCFLLMFLDYITTFSLFVVHILTLRTLSSPQTITPHPRLGVAYLLTYLSRCPIDVI